MLRKSLLAIVAITSIGVASPALAWGGHKHTCYCGHTTCTTSTSSTTSSTTSTTSGTTGSTSSTTGGTDVPEPGMLGLLGAGLFGLGAIRLRRRIRK